MYQITKKKVSCNEHNYITSIDIIYMLNVRVLLSLKNGEFEF